MRIDLGTHRPAQRDCGLSNRLQGAFPGGQADHSPSRSSIRFFSTTAAVRYTLQTLPAPTPLRRKLLLILRDPAKHTVLPPVRPAKYYSKQVQPVVAEKGSAIELPGDSGVRTPVRLHAVSDKQPPVPSK